MVSASDNETGECKRNACERQVLPPRRYRFISHMRVGNEKVKYEKNALSTTFLKLSKN